MARVQDELTGLAGREALRVALATQTAMQKGDGAGLALLDVDLFGEINHEFGSETGDRVLTALADLLREMQTEAGNGATAFRLSGDEFALLLPNATLEAAFLRAEAFRARVEAETTARRVAPDGRAVTVTIGVAQFPRDARTAEGVLKASEAALAARKEQGRNAVGLPPNEEMVMKSCYYPAPAVRKLKALSEKTARKESALLREALTDLIGKYDTL